MILIFEQDIRDSFEWIPELFVSFFDGKKTWRFCWGWWSLSCYASEGLKDFMDFIVDGGARWYHD
jgi:hypothetical protein